LELGDSGADGRGRGRRPDHDQFPGISAAKIKEECFHSPENFRLSDISSSTQWNDFLLLVTNFVGNNKADNNNVPVKGLLLSYQKFGCIMSFKIQLTNYDQDILPGKYWALDS
jgi:hypothetical protein